IIAIEMQHLSLHDALPIFEAGARAGLISPDQTTLDYLRIRPNVPKGEAFEKAAEQWLSLATDEGATYDKTLNIDASEVEPQVTWGTNPGMGAPISGHTPIIDEAEDKDGVKRALENMDLEENKQMTDIEIDHVVVGSCTNSRLRVLRKTSAIVKVKKKQDYFKEIVCTE